MVPLSSLVLSVYRDGSTLTIRSHPPCAICFLCSFWTPYRLPHSRTSCPSECSLPPTRPVNSSPNFPTSLVGLSWRLPLLSSTFPGPCLVKLLGVPTSSHSGTPVILSSVYPPTSQSRFQCRPTSVVIDARWTFCRTRTFIEVRNTRYGVSALISCARADRPWSDESTRVRV